MNWLLTIFGMAVYTGFGLIMSSVTTNHVNNLCDKVAEIDPRYSKRLWFSIRLKRSKWKEFMVDVAFMAFWPVFCVTAILKAEWQYDLIVHHSAFTKRTAR